ncbi:MAG: quinone oxidoreductase [Thermus sp.]|uniref:quinone oxidoreductase family protein n=1 Tax=Thermus sp. TaxID=275 RepID=UPI0025EC4D28|nr:quinone oxidoreductase [Thermus sp.]MCS6867605.1 quinone oxidoreductase [Thermus sp.]MCS7217743.1 quinone oxidoreductase [Thermus sp.]MCX7849531.1 quinone oxidoreductase [Thermus sp.]MDW8016560.1 quinone oxidoreductase [Thermus sp.]MDW8357563.1 quinone oxidoreductase [Thermus sp.]
MRAIRVHQVGGPEVMRLEELPLPEPGPGEVLVRLLAIGVNYIDTYKRRGLYPMPLPFTLGEEGAGVVERVGEGVEGVRPGDRVAFANVQGAYAEYQVVPAERLVPLPEGLDPKLAAASLLQGMTVHYLLKSTYPVAPGDQVLVHAGAGGVGTLLIQWAKRLGATVYATASTEEKRALARALGADYALPYEGFAQAVKALSGGGVDVVYDGVGQATFQGSLEALRPRGYLVLFGQSSGPVPPLDPQELNRKGSLFLTRPTLHHHTASRKELLFRAGEVFQALREGWLRVRIGAEFPLERAQEAHQALEGRKTTGKVLLIP